ncbi:diacylglycerol/lipid kinase family protein [Sporanaerobacter sp. PP17-6a]|uniref:diacylglycerol/lipid kinase family protein n=1 Tax=Sporanaerobacter sp. PP17-6a TaxID=1891289 RepID=UPI00089FD20A|nr:diacylglycerol kinase family protein [Sporanaerobacter sp. PP17-6a]SCL96577.1 Diacylglycerol kinase [Sporanaerobacter sp. PP17-6a]
MDSILFIINPIAGNGRAKSLISIIKSTMEENKKKYDISITHAPKEAIKIAKEGISKGHKIIVAVGGDGTINEVATGIMRGGKGILGIIPGGTGNDLARTLKIPENPREALRLILIGNSKKIDTCFVNNNLFLNIASIGLDSEVIKNIWKIRSRINGRISYVIGFIRTLLSYKYKILEIEIDNMHLNEEVILAAIGNGKYYGGGMKICPSAIIEDGYFNVCVIRRINIVKLFLVFPSIFWGEHIKFGKYVNIYKGKEIKIKGLERLWLNIDGELKEIGEEASFTINNKGLNVVCE